MNLFMFVSSYLVEVAVLTIQVEAGLWAVRQEGPEALCPLQEEEALVQYLRVGEVASDLNI